MAFLPILHESSNQYYWKGTGELSIKSFHNGSAYYNTGQGHFQVGEDRFLLLNRGREYSITIESVTPVESFCVFFPDDMVKDTYRTLVVRSEQLLDMPFDPSLQPPDFIEKTYAYDQLLFPALLHLRAQHTRQNGVIYLEEMLRILLHKLFSLHRQVHIEMEKLPSVRASTREELYRRLQIGHDYIYACFNKPIGLEDAARAACLSPNHFLRNYKRLFGITPHQYLTERRLQEAKKLLMNPDLSVTEICLEVGFQSLGSFSALFCRKFGMPPTRMREKK